ncbi:pkb-activating kinase-like protein [Boothiomyces sp. JEL0866]|nr:pkb-activating kinase-like protein [Boothiomyces sp. JEL0866]
MAESEELRKRVPQDFVFGQLLGEGSYSTVLYCTEKNTPNEYAVKILEKQQIIREKKVKYVTIEKDVLHLLSHPFIIKLFYTFQDTMSLYFVLEYCNNGDLLQLLNKYGIFSIENTIGYMQEIISAVDYMHSKKVVHRDLKPENILLASDFHIKITDFGTAKILEETELKRKGSFVGTAEYCSPELLNNKECSFSSDIWSLGCILYQLAVGVPPFKGSNEYQTFQKIINSEYELPPILDEKITMLVKSILVPEPERINLEGMKKDSLFAGLDWEISRMKDRKFKFEYIEPLLKPKVFIDQFEPNFQAEIESMDEQFQDLKYIEDVDSDSDQDIKFSPEQYSYEVVHSSLVKQKTVFFSRVRGLILTKDSLVLVDLQTNQCTEMKLDFIQVEEEDHGFSCLHQGKKISIELVCYTLAAVHKAIGVKKLNNSPHFTRDITAKTQSQSFQHKMSITCSYDHSKRGISTGIIEQPPAKPQDSYPPTPTTDKSSLSDKDYDLEFKFMQESMIERYAYFSSMGKEFLSKYLHTDFAGYVLRAGYYINKRDVKALVWLESSLIEFPNHLEPNLSNLLSNLFLAIMLCKYGKKLQGVGVFGHVVRSSKILGINDENRLQYLVEDQEFDDVRCLWWHIYQIDQYLWFHNAGFLCEEDHNVFLPDVHGEFEDQLGRDIMSSKDWFTPPFPNESINTNKILLNRIFGHAIRLQRAGNELQMTNLQGSLQLWYMNLPEKFHLHFRLIYDYNPMIENPQQTWKILDTLIEFHFTKILVSEPLFYRNFQTVQASECTSTEQSMLYTCKQITDIFLFYLQQNPSFEYTSLFYQIYSIHIITPLFLISKIRTTNVQVDHCISIMHKAIELLCTRHGDEFGTLTLVENWYLVDAQTIMESFYEFSEQMSHI